MEKTIIMTIKSKKRKKNSINLFCSEENFSNFKEAVDKVAIRRNNQNIDNFRRKNR
jgi:hypothetical protein